MFATRQADKGGRNKEGRIRKPVREENGSLAKWFREIRWGSRAESLLKAVKSNRGQWLSTLNSLAFSLSLIFPAVPVLEYSKAPVT